MDLIDSLNDKVIGITLSSQNIDLFNIVEQVKEQVHTHEEGVEEVYQYLKGLLDADSLSKKLNQEGLSTAQKIKMVVDEKATRLQNKDEFLRFIQENAMQIRANWSSRESLEEIFAGEVDSSYIDTILDIKNYFVHQPHGILTFLVDEDGQTIDPESEKIEIDKEKTYQKVEALYDYVVGNIENGEHRFNRLTLDGQGKFGPVAGLIRTEDEKNAEPQDYDLEQLIQGYEFAKKHGMDVRINALVFFKDFPDRLINADEETCKIALENYGKAVASVANKYNDGVLTTLDMFNEFVTYKEPFKEQDDKWLSKLSIEKLCEIASKIKAEMPENVEFGYNDWNFENSEKRKVIFRVLRRIQDYEKDNNCKIIDYIGTQCHTTINDIEGFRASIEELQEFGLPIYITELDISKGIEGIDYERLTPSQLTVVKKYEQHLQNKMMQFIRDFVEEGKIAGVTAWSASDEVCPVFCDGKQASVIGMSYDREKGFTFSGKEIEPIEMTEEEMQIITNLTKYRHFKDKDTAKCYLTEQQIGMLIANQSVIAKNNAQKQYMNDEKDLENTKEEINKGVNLDGE